MPSIMIVRNNPYDNIGLVAPSNKNILIPPPKGNKGKFYLRPIILLMSISQPLMSSRDLIKKPKLMSLFAIAARLAWKIITFLAKIRLSKVKRENYLKAMFRYLNPATKVITLTLRNELYSYICSLVNRL